MSGGVVPLLLLGGGVHVAGRTRGEVPFSMLFLSLSLTLAANVATLALPPAAQDAPTAPPGAPDSTQEQPAQPVEPVTEQEQPVPPQSGSTAALEELLKRLSAERSQPSVVAPSDAAPDLLEGDTFDPLRLLARLTRASDSIGVMRPDGLRRDLQFWDKVYGLEAGDEVRQDGRGCALLEYEDGANFRFDGEAIWRMASDALANPRELEIVRLARYADLWLGRGDVDTVFWLPGGNELAANGSRIVLQDHDRRAIEIRVTGPSPAVVRSPYLGGRAVRVRPGQRIFLPVLAEPVAFVPHLVREASLFDEMRGRLRVQAPEAIDVEPLDQALELTGSGPIPGIVRACGARLVMQPGQTMRLTRAPLGAPRRQEQDE